MRITKKIDRAFQWAGEKMGAEAKTSMSEDFKMLEVEMALRFEGMDRLQRSMNAYVKWLGRRGETFDDKEKGLPVSYLGRTMISHGEDFEPDSEFGNCLITMGRANERVAGIQDHFVADATATWLESLERSLAMMKEYQSSRKKLENRRLAYDASITRMQKAKRDDFRIEEELRTNKAKYDESSEDVVRRMQDIKDAEVDSVRDLTHFLDAELDYHERCAEELRRARRSWVAAAPEAGGSSNGYGGAAGLLPERRPMGRSRSNTAHSYSERLSRTSTNNNIYEAEEPEPEPVRMPIRSTSRPSINSSSSVADLSSTRPSLATAHTFHSGMGMGSGIDRDRPTSRSTNGASTPNSISGYSYGSGGGGSGSAQVNGLNVGALRGALRPTSRAAPPPPPVRDSDVFADRDDDTASGGSSPQWGAARSASPATSFDSLSRSTSNLGSYNGGGGAGLGQRKAPPPPPPSRSKKPPPPPVPAKREIGY